MAEDTVQESVVDVEYVTAPSPPPALGVELKVPVAPNLSGEGKTDAVIVLVARFTVRVEVSYTTAVYESTLLITAVGVIVYDPALSGLVAEGP